MQDAGGFSFILQKMDAGNVDIISTEGVINIKPVADPHDFGCFSRGSDLTELYRDGADDDSGR